MKSRGVGVISSEKNIIDVYQEKGGVRVGDGEPVEDEKGFEFIAPSTGSLFEAINDLFEAANMIGELRIA